MMKPDVRRTKADFADATDMTFGEALEALKLGCKVQRQFWDGAQLEMCWPSSLEEVTEPYIYISYYGSTKVPWNSTHEELLAEDWMII